MSHAGSSITDFGLFPERKHVVHSQQNGSSGYRVLTTVKRKNFWTMGNQNPAILFAYFSGIFLTIGSTLILYFLLPFIFYGAKHEQTISLTAVTSVILQVLLASRAFKGKGRLIPYVFGSWFAFSILLGFYLGFDTNLRFFLGFGSLALSWASFSIYIQIRKGKSKA